MLNFAYKGISQGKYVEGEIEAINNSEAAYKLKERKVILPRIPLGNGIFRVATSKKARTTKMDWPEN